MVRGQHFVLHKYKDARGIPYDENDFVTFQLVQVKVGQGNVQISVVLYMIQVNSGL